ncbi:MAG TPA: DUF423 domain-containing protein [Xanthomonadales bacterium]|nr:DUF423 domain-containing protein [Xanthomonadales bacterium]
MMVADQPVLAWRWLAIAAAVLGLIAVLLGAMGSHAVDLTAAGAEQRWNTALQIHYFQAAALMALASLSASQAGGNRLLLPGLLQLSGTLLFCGNLYLRALQIELLPGWITPAGGLILLTGWLLLIAILLKNSR